MRISHDDHVALFDCFLGRRREIVERIESRLLNVRDKDLSRSRDRRLFEQILNACFFDLPGLPRDALLLKGQLTASHLADGFEPVVLDRFANELDPLQLVVQAYRYWDSHRWPGRSGRLTFADTVYAVFLIRQLEYLSLRIWDDGDDRAEERLHDIQRLLDRLNESAATCLLLRDVRWLLQTAQGPLTRYLQPYFRIAEQISATGTAATRLAVHEAGAKLAGGHLRSQLRYRMWETGRPLGDHEILAITRNSNSMDLALLVRDLVPLLGTYSAARRQDDLERRLELADAILQGLSADPDVLLTRLDLLGPCTMIEDLFTTRDDDGRARYMPRGEAHLALLERYGESIGELAESLIEDARELDPALRVYSPYGVTYGFSGDLLANLAMATLVGQPTFHLSLEDLFVSRGRLEEKVARVDGWRALPKTHDQHNHGDHSAEWAREMFERMRHALHARAARKTEPNASGVPSGKVWVVPEAEPSASPPDVMSPATASDAQDHCYTTDVVRAASSTTVLWPAKQMATDRAEGRFLASAESNGHWFGVSKVILSLFSNLGKDAVIAGVPRRVIDVLRLTCPGIVVLPKDKDTERIKLEV